jgi:hypothetical protein
MERLTERIDDVPDGESGVWVKNHDYILAAEKLADYEDLEEQGRLLKLPCKIGDDVYFVPSEVNYKLNILNKHSENNKVYHQKVEDFVLTRHGWYLECDQDVKYGTGHILTDVSFCKTWFLTKSEAEAKLKELRCNND